MPSFKHGKGAELGQAGDLGFHQLADLQVANIVLPGIILHAADGKADVPFFFVNADDLDIHFLPNFQHIAGMADLVPGDLTDTCTRPSAPLTFTNAPKSARLVTRPLSTVANFQFFDHLVADGIAGFVNGCFFREDQSAPFLVNLDDLKGDLGRSFRRSAFLVIAAHIAAPAEAEQ